MWYNANQMFSSLVRHDKGGGLGGALELRSVYRWRRANALPKQTHFYNILISSLKNTKCKIRELLPMMAMEQTAQQ